MIKSSIFNFSHHAMPSFIKYIILSIMFTCCLCQQQDNHLIIRTIEKLPVHTEVINLRQLLFGKKDFNENLRADFSLAKRDEFPYMFFLINHSTRGILTIRKEINRDELCRLRRCRCDTWCDLELEIFINSEQLNIELLTIRILDRNDHQPTFLNHQLNLTIVENAPIGAGIKLEPAIDHDQGQNSIIGYSLVSSTPLPFSLRYDLIRNDLSLIIDQKLDREQIPAYQFDIIARDGDNQTGILHVLVYLSDINDSPPKFDRTIYSIYNISETASMDSILLRVHANDADESINAEISYYLLNEQECFHIDQRTGDIRVRCLLDYETKSVYRLEIEARDNGEGYKTDFSTVFIHLVDENDNSPIIDIYRDDFEIEFDPMRIFLNESIPIQTLICSISIIDHDSGENGRVSWKLKQIKDNPFELIHLTETTGELRTRLSLDRESISEYNLTIVAHDHGKPYTKSTYLNLQIIILDENDHSPQFRQKNLTVTINENVQFNTSIGYDVFQIIADDNDQGFNGEIVYSLLNNDDDYFHIDSKTGVIRAMKQFDQKSNDTYILHVQARDQGTPSLSSQTMITFKIINRNEYAPVCDILSKHIQWSIMENSDVGTIVGMFSCRDDDQDEFNGQLTVHSQWFKHENQTDIPFEIRLKQSNISQSMVIIIFSVNGSIDRELISSYSSYLTVSDRGNPRQSINYTLTIQILDENDHCPQLHFDSSFILINRDLTKDFYRMHLIATDQDENANGNLTFQLSPSTSPLFLHLYSNGTLEVQTNSNFISNDTFVILHIQIRDHGQPTPCFIVETLRLYIGSNRTDWMTIIKDYQYDDTSLRLATEEFEQGKRMAHSYPISSSSISSPLFQYSSTLSSRKHLFAVFLGSAILMFIVILTMVLCFIDCIQKKSKQNSHLSILKSNGINSSNSFPLINGKTHLTIKPKHFYEDHSSTCQYKNLNILKPVIVTTSSSSNSHSTSSIDSTTRANTAHNRAITNTYTYTALSTSEDLMPVDFDSNLNDNGVELMMTTV